MLQVGPYEGRHFTHTEIYDPADQRQSEYGRILFVLESDTHPELGAEIQSTILTTIKELFYSDLTRDPYESFEQALQAVNDKLGNLAMKGVTDWIGRLNVVISILSDTTLHLSQTGTGTLLLIRGETATNISAGLSPSDATASGEKTFCNISSGSLLQGDYLLFISNDNYDAVADRDIVQTMRTVQFTDRTGLSQKLGGLNVNGTPVDLMVVRVGSAARTFGLDITDMDGASDTGSIPTSIPGEVAAQAKGLAGKLLHQGLASITAVIKRATSKSAPADTTSEIYGTASGPVTGKTKFSNTMQLLRDNSIKGMERLFRRKSHTGLLTARAQRKRLIVWLLIILLIVGGTYWLILQRRASLAHQEMEQLLQDVRDSQGIAKTRSIYEPDSAKNMLVGLQRKAQRIIDESNDPELRTQATEELVNIGTLLDKVDKVFRIDAPKVVYDLSTERPNIQARGLLGLAGQIYAFDHNALYMLVLDNIDTRKLVVGQDETLEILDADGFSQEQEIVILTKNNGVVEYKDGQFAYGAVQDQTWNPGVAITDYDSARIVYLLDTANNEVWRYSRARSGFDSPQKKNVSAQDLSTAIDFAIDGAIYVLKADGTVVKYFNDALAPFEFTGLVTPITVPAKIIADTDTDAGFLYVLDAGNKRVVVTGKGGEYIAQYVFETAENLVDLYIDEETDTIYVLEQNGKVYQTEIKHYGN